MDGIALHQLFLGVLQTTVVAAVVLLLYRLRSIFGLSLLYLTLGIFRGLHFMVSKTFAVQILPGIQISLGSSVFFTVFLFVILLIYIREGPFEARKLIYSLVFAALVFALMQWIITLGFGQPGMIHFYNNPKAFFGVSWRVLGTGLIMMLLDSLLIIFTYEKVSSITTRYFFRIFLTMAIILVWHSVIFAVFAFGGTPRFMPILMGGLVSKGLPLVMYTLLFWLYLVVVEKREPTLYNADYQLKDAFDLLTYRSKYEVAIRQKQVAEKALHLSEEKFRTAINSIGEAVMTTDRSGKVAHMNPMAEKLTGWLLSEAKGQPLENVFHIISEDNRQKVESPVSRVLREGKVVGLANHTLLITKSGNEVPIADSGAPIKNDQGQIEGVVLVFKDQSHERELMRQLREAEEKYRIAFKTSPDAITLNRLDGTYVDVNEGFTQLTGYTFKEVIGKTSLALNLWVDPSDRETLRKGLRDKGNIRNMESAYRLRDGSIKFALISASMINIGNTPHILSVIKDITDRLKDEQALKELNSKLNAVFEHSLNAIFIINEKGIIVFANRSTATVFGYPLESMIGSHFEKFVTEESLPKVQDRFRRRQSGEEVPARYDISVIRKDGVKRKIEISAAAISDAQNEKTTIVHAYDITERLDAEAQLKNSEKRLKEAEKIAHLGYWELYIPENKLYWSDEVYRIFGLEPQEFGATYEAFLDFIHPDDREKVNRAYLHSLDTRQAYDIVHRIVLKSGEVKWVHEKCHTSFDASGKALLSMGTVLDITEIKRAETALKESLQRFEHLFQDSPVPLWEEDFTELAAWLEGLKKQGVTDLNSYLNQHPGELAAAARKVKVLDVNRATIELYQAKSKEELLGSLDKTFTNRSFSVFKESLLALFRGASRFEAESEVKTLQGETRIVKLKIRMVPSSAITKGRHAFIGFNDITVLKKVENEIKKSKAYFQSIFDASTDAIFIHDGETGMVLDVNSAMCKMYGYEKEEVLFKKVEFFSAGKSPYSETEATAWIQQSRKQPITFEWRARHKEGHLFWVEVRIRFANIGGQGRYIAMVRNIEERKKAEAEIKKLSLVVDQNTAMVVMTDTSGRITYVNPRFCQVTGYTQEEVLGENPRFLKSGDKSQQEYQQLWDTILAGNTWRGEFLNKKKDGTLYYELASIFPLYDEWGKVIDFVAIKEEITERKQAELAVHQAKARLEVLHNLDKSILASESVDSIAGEALRRLENLSDAKRIAIALVSEQKEWAHVYSIGLMADKIGAGMKVPAADAFPNLRMLQAGRVVEIKRLDAFKNKGESLKCLMEAGISSILSIPVKMGNRLLGSLNMAFENPEAFSTDEIELGKEVADTLAIAFEQNRMTQNLQKHALELEKRLKELKSIHDLGRRLGKSTDTTQMAQVIVDEVSEHLQPDITLLYLKQENQLQLLASANHTTHFSFSGEALHPVGECLCGTAAQQATPLYSVNIHEDLRCTMNNCKNAGIRSFAGIPLLAEEEVIGVLGLGFVETQNFDKMRSYIETMASETAMGLQNILLLEALRKHEAELEQTVAKRTNELLVANKELESFAYSVSHDLRAPLRAISGFSEIIMETHRDSMDEEALKLFQYIRESATNMSQLILDLLKFSRLIQSKGKRESVDLKQLLNETLRNLDEGIKVQKAKIKLPGTFPAFNSDRTLLNQILQNLIQNAITYHKPGEPPLIQIQVDETEKTVTLAVRDHGIGIAKEHQQKIFEVFQRLHKQEDYPGTGIGLALVKKAVSKLGGRIWLESVPDEGTTFFVELPKE